MNDLAHHFMPGHRIMVQIQSSMFPFIVMSTQNFVDNPYYATAKDYLPSEVAVHSGFSDPSYIELPVLK
jgi:predicted acyl esterase